MMAARLTGATMLRCRVTSSTIVPTPGMPESAEQASRKIAKFLETCSDEQRLQMGAGASPSSRPATGASGGCFIATAACGTPRHADVVVLREFRDTVLRDKAMGRAFIRVYEATSPGLAAVIARAPALQRLVRTVLVKPASDAARYLLRR